MASTLKTAIAFTGLILPLSSTLILTTPFTQAATANPRGMQGSYVGVTVDGENPNESLRSLTQSSDDLIGVLNQALNPGTITGDRAASEIADRQYQGRLDVPNAPISVRATVVMGESVKAVLPTLSYDVAIAEGANVYAGAGYAFVREPGEATPLGDRNGVVLTTGAEASVGDGMVVYGDVRFRPNAAQATDTSAVRVQVGVGRRF